MRLRQGVLLSAVMALTVSSLSAREMGSVGAGSGAAVTSEPEAGPPALPRWREGGTPYDHNQPLQPYAIQVGREKDHPSGLIESPSEYDPVRGVIFWYANSQWPDVVTDLVVTLTESPVHDEIAYVVVTSSYQQTQATNAFVAGGADMSKVQFIIEPGNAIWIRDYGPHFIWHEGALAIVDSQYYPTRPLDNFIPTLLGDDHFLMPTYDMGLYYSGGNFMPGPDRSAFVASLITLDNPPSAGFDEAFIAELYSQYQGIDTLHIMPQLPSSVDGTGHIDMWMYIVDQDSVMISQFQPGSNPTAMQITDDAVRYMADLGFTVHRPPAWNVGTTHYTYTNGFRVNDRIFISTYGEGNPAYLDEDADALAAWQAAAGPAVEIVPINCYGIIWAAGAIHCIVMQVPRYTDPVPSAHVISPAGGELLVGGTTHTITWAATDTDNATIPQIDLYYSINDGDTYEYIATTTDTGAHDWAVPEVSTAVARVKVVATSADLDQVEAVSAGSFEIAQAQQRVYDFATGASVDKFGRGHHTISWASGVDGDRTPISTEISTLVTGAYGKLAHSDATGGDGDSDRYISPNPSNNYESTHVFEFTIDEDPAVIDDVGILWEGYADQCAQIELYVWDYVEGQWSDGGGLSGQNRFVDNWAGNQDGYLEGHLRSNLDRYIDGSGQMTLLLYAERGTAYYGYYVYTPTFHDYMALTVSLVAGSGDYDGDGDVDLDDFAYWDDCVTGPDNGPYGAGCQSLDFEPDNDVDLDDFAEFQEAFGT